MTSNADTEQEPTSLPPATETPKNKKTTKSKKANLFLPVARVDRLLREGYYSKQYSMFASVYLTSALETISGKLIKKAGEETLKQGRIIIQPTDMVKAVEQDIGLTKLLSGPHSLQIANSK